MPFLIALRNHWDTLVVFFSAAAFLIYALCMFAHLRLLAADLGELDRLRQDGLMPIARNLHEDYRTLSYLLEALAPTVAVRRELWVSIYYRILRAGQWCFRGSFFERELRGLVAYQASLYRLAYSRLIEPEL